jgi:hypothetical protein
MINKIRRGVEDNSVIDYLPTFSYKTLDAWVSSDATGPTTSIRLHKLI